MPPIDSRRWTGPIDEQSGGRRGLLGRPGDPHFSTDYARLAEAQRVAMLIPPERRGVMRAAAWLLVSPLSLLLAWLVVQAAIRDYIAQDRRDLLIAWGVAAAAIGFWQLKSRTLILARARTLFLRSLAVITCLMSFGYGYLALSSRAQAVARAPERVFQIPERRGRSFMRRTVYHHQRADGTTLEGGAARTPLAEAHVCALAQRLDGRHGFSWVRVLERSRASGRGQLSWPISSEECFGSIPLSELPR